MNPDDKEHMQVEQVRQETEPEYRSWAIRGLLKWLFIASAVAIGVAVALALF